MKKFVSIFKTNAFKITLLVGLFLTSALIIVAVLLGKEAGTFVIRVQDGSIDRSIAITETIEDESSYKSTLKANGKSNFTDYSPRFFLPGNYETLNSFTEKGGEYAHVDRGSGIALYCYTFYVVNTGIGTVNVNVSMDFGNVTNHLDEVVRIMTYYTNDRGEEVPHIYQKTDTEFEEYDAYMVAPQEFASDDEVFNDEVLFLDINDYVKYSVIFWLEGDDPDSEKYGKLLYNGTIQFTLDLAVDMSVAA